MVRQGEVQVGKVGTVSQVTSGASFSRSLAGFQVAFTTLNLATTSTRRMCRSLAVGPLVDLESTTTVDTQPLCYHFLAGAASEKKKLPRRVQWNAPRVGICHKGVWCA